MKHNYLTRILVAAVSLSAFASNSAFAEETTNFAEETTKEPLPLTTFDFVSCSLLKTDLMTWIGIGIFVALVAVLVGWLWGRAWNRLWKPWASPLPCYSIFALLAIITLMTSMYITTPNTEIFYDTINVMENQNNYRKIETDADRLEAISKLQKANLFKFFEMVYDKLDPVKSNDITKTKKDEDDKPNERAMKIARSYSEINENSFKPFHNMSIWGLWGALACLFILVAALSYSDIKLIEPSVKE